jgi:hypothetical protein
MDPYEILAMLKDNPGQAYITPDRKQLYVLFVDTDEMLCFTGDFSFMSDERINKFIQDWLK